ncbi:hypothetical protein L1267_17900 [Pseudoalteromonas sp. OFAV1]|uniref:hypothetical protein n=1 Tax=Pseudoalteromonas sp. OFAV1 TaxID=2908892 RepID=UPI001F1D1C99|nr:hypothetical protein [Pseudoalteromonas sp. OFAV1]MCF2902246.1 hypothetical protein [Pseudoalteromonas sp. OFAV1]
MTKEDLFEKLREHFSENIHKTEYFPSFGETKYPERGALLFAELYIGKEFCFDNQLSRVVQIRTGCGQFGSDMYFLRLPDGRLQTSENQSYKLIPEEFRAEVESFFETDMEFEQEGFDEGYTIGGEQLEVGYIIDGSNTKGSPDTPFTITVTKQS